VIPQLALPRRAHSAIGLLAVLSIGLAACSSPSPTHTSSPPPTAPTIKTPSTFQHLGAIAFTRASAGYGFFEYGQGTQCQGLVGSTTDGGQNFGTLAPVNSWTCNVSPPANQLVADNQGNVFLYGPALYISHDAGKTWNFSLQAGAVMALSDVGGSIWMLQAGCKLGTTATASCPIHLLRSSDGGTTWHTVTLPTSFLLTSTFVQELSLGQSWLLRTGTNAALLVAQPVSNAQGVADYGTFWSTTDAGATWSLPHQLPCGIAAGQAALATAPGQLYAVCAGAGVSGQQQKSVLRSKDGGQSWTRQITCSLPNPQPPAGCRNGAIINGYLGNVVAISAKTLYVVGPRSPLLVSHDSGTTWNPVTPLIGDSATGTAQESFFNQRQGVVLAQSTSVYVPAPIWSTSDGGTTWHKVIPRATVPTTTGSAPSG
jgi:photosystem II stability/assembly factor-like uncharacterized protein